MSRATVTQAAITRAVKAVQAAGVPVGRVEIDPEGLIVVIASDDAKARPAINDWDRP